MKGYTDQLNKIDWFERCSILAKNLSKPLRELINGSSHGTIPWNRCLSLCLVLELFLFFKVDFYILSKTRFSFLYPRGFWLYHVYYLFVIALPFLAWGLEQAIKRDRITKTLEDTFESIGLKNNLGKIPQYVFDVPIDETTRKLRLTRSAISAGAFADNRARIEGAMHIFIDEFRENRTKGTIDVIYSSTEMPEKFLFPDYKNVSPPGFVVGTSRSKVIRSNLIDTPHLLIAGQSGGGKSTFTRQFITTLYLNDKSAQFTIIDLKGSVESQFFEGLKRISVPETMQSTIYALESLSLAIDYRLKVLKANGCKDILEYFRKPSSERVFLPAPEGRVSEDFSRHIVVIDEAAEMFLAGEGRTSSSIQNAKHILSKIARQGRAIGLHLVVATQRPDARALDTQIKANLSGVLCFQMVNDSSSILVLGNGRATDLPPVAGRAIWKTGREMVEVQTPFLSEEDTKKLLRTVRESQGKNFTALTGQSPEIPSETDRAL